MFWGIVINFNVNNGCVEYFIPPEFEHMYGPRITALKQEKMVIAECDMIGSKVLKLFRGSY
jgi:hypothetical protein